MRKLATIQIIEELKPIKEADRIEVARIKGWWVVVRKDEFKVGQRIIYYEIDSFLPLKPEYDFLLKGSSAKKMLVDGGKEVEGIRLKTIKLRGQVSQGLVLAVPEGITDEIGADVSEKLGVIKYEMPIPASLSGKCKGVFPYFLEKTDEERIQNMVDVLAGFYVTEKLDGTSVTFYNRNGEFGVCSRNLELSEGEVTQWRIAKALQLPTKIPVNFALQGELVGEGIQGNPLKIKGQEVYFFNAFNIEAHKFLDFDDFLGICNSLGVKTVPVIDYDFALPKSVDEMLLIAEGKSLINPTVEREGIVVRPKIEMQYKGQRFSFKAISNKYLLEEN
jgi:RNA ligase (TIGR02306 family)